VGEFVKVERQKADRPELIRAVCRKQKATLVIAKPDRLSRSIFSCKRSPNHRRHSVRNGGNRN
jgi:hypothetical protein